MYVWRSRCKGRFRPVPYAWIHSLSVLRLIPQSIIDKLQEHAVWDHFQDWPLAKLLMAILNGNNVLVFHISPGQTQSNWSLFEISEALNITYHETEKAARKVICLCNHDDPSKENVWKLIAKDELSALSSGAELQLSSSFSLITKRIRDFRSSKNSWWK
jgi:hypothetical protein